MGITGKYTMKIISAISLLICGFSLSGIEFDKGGEKLLNIIPLKYRCLKTEDVSVAVYPHSFIDADKSFYLNHGQITAMTICFANPKACILDKAQLIVSLPEGVELFTVGGLISMPNAEFKNQGELISIENKKYTRYSLQMINWHPRSIPNKVMSGPFSYQFDIPVMLWLKTDAPIGSTPGRAIIALEYIKKGQSEYSSTRPVEFALKILSTAKAQSPVLTKTAAMGRFTLISAARNKIKGINTLVRQLGYNGILNNTSSPELLPDGLDLWRQGCIQNGSEVMISPELITPEVAFISAKDWNGHKNFITNKEIFAKRSFAKVICPAVIYRREAWYKKNIIEDALEPLIKGGMNCLFNNFEPNARMKTNDGCFCDRCLEDFVRNSGLPPDELKKEWPENIKIKYAEKWQKFRNWQYGMILKTLNEDLINSGNKLNRKVYLNVATSNDGLWNEKDFSINCREWGDLPFYLTTWQYYWVPLIYGNAPYNDRQNVWQVVRSASIERYFDKIYSRDRNIKYGCMYGYQQSGTGYFTPEQLKFLHETGVFCRNKIIFNYPEYPVFDGRWAIEIARANSRIAYWENEILNSEIRNDHTTEIISPNPELLLNIKQKDDPEKALVDNGGDNHYLFSFEYKNKNRIIIPVANVWQHGDCFFKLHINVPDGRYILSEPEENRIFAGEKGITVSSEDLKSGMLLHVGAVRWAVFQLEPERKLNGSEIIIRQNEIFSALVKRNQELTEVLKTFPPGNMKK